VGKVCLTERRNPSILHGVKRYTGDARYWRELTHAQRAEFLGVEPPQPDPELSPRAKRNLVPHRLQQLREEQDWSQELLAEVFGVSRQTINAIEKGRSTPSLRLAMALARFFGTSVEDLFNEHVDDSWLRRLEAVERLRSNAADPSVKDARQMQWGVSRIGPHGAQCPPKEQVARGLRGSIPEGESSEQHAERIFNQQVTRALITGLEDEDD